MLIVIVKVDTDTTRNLIDSSIFNTCGTFILPTAEALQGLKCNIYLLWKLANLQGNLPHHFCFKNILKNNNFYSVLYFPNGGHGGRRGPCSQGGPHLNCFVLFVFLQIKISRSNDFIKLVLINVIQSILLHVLCYHKQA